MILMGERRLGSSLGVRLVVGLGGCGLCGLCRGLVGFDRVLWCLWGGLILGWEGVLVWMFFPFQLGAIKSSDVVDIFVYLKVGEKLTRID